MKIGAQTYTVREFMKTPQEIRSSFKKIKEIGFDIVQLSGLGPIDADELAGILKDNALNAVLTHSPWERVGNKDELKKLIDDHKKWGCIQIGIGKKPPLYPDTYEGYTDFIKKVNEICDQVEDAGLSFGYHNHEFEFERFNGVCALDRLINECPKLKFILDVFWVQAGGANPCLYIEKLKDRIDVLHLKDYRMIGKTRQFAEIGQGNLDWKGIFASCEKTNIPYAVIEQDADFISDPFDSLALSRQFLLNFNKDFF